MGSGSETKSEALALMDERFGRNTEIAAKLREVFASCYSNGHTDEADPNTCILRIKLTRGVLFNHGVRYDIDFSENE